VTRLHDLFSQQAQSPWLDNLRRDWIANGELQAWIDKGIRGITSNPSIFQNAIANSDAYDDQFRELVATNKPIEDIYWDLVVTDIENALTILRPTFDESNGEDGYVSVEVAPALAHDEKGTVEAALELHRRIDEPNVYVKIPATVEGVAAIQQVIAAGKSVNVTLIFSLDRYAAVMDAYIAGLEACEGDLSGISSVASFFISRVDTEVDNRLGEIDTPEAAELQGTIALAQGHLAYQLFLETFSGPRWEALAARGARKQRPLWASTSTKNEAYSDTLYVDELIGPDTVNTVPDKTLADFEDHGTVARTVDADPDTARARWAKVAELGVDMDDVAAKLEDAGVASFAKAFDELLATLTARAEELRQ
jgi:transaldolase